MYCGVGISSPLPNVTTAEWYEPKCFFHVMHPDRIGPNQMSSSLYAGLDVFEKFGLPILREVKRDALDAYELYRNVDTYADADDDDKQKPAKKMRYGEE
jgi:hypothetical protein